MSGTGTALTAEEARVVGSLVEKQLTTPRYYPLTLNALIAACNQSNNRDPVVDYDDATIEDALATLREKGLVRLVHPGGGSRVTKYRHVVDETLGLDSKELALVCVLLLRGPQTLNELRARTERMARFDGAADVERDLDRLAARDVPLVERLGRQPGQREERFATLLVSRTDAAATSPRRPAVPASAGPRIHPLPSAAMTDDQRELVAVTGAEGNHLFGTVVRNPRLMRRWLPLAGELLRHGRLEARHREIAILRTAWLTAAAYEWGHHAQIAVADAGLSVEDVTRVAAGDGAGWQGLDLLVIRACDDIDRDGFVSAETWDGLAAELDEAALIELVFLVGHYRMIATVIASLGVQPEPGLPPLPSD